MTIYIDNEFMCHTTPAEGRREFDVLFFDGKCRTFIEGYIFVPSGEVWEREDGKVFTGEMITPWRDYTILSAAQEAYTEAFADRADMVDALNRLGVTT